MNPMQEYDSKVLGSWLTFPLSFPRVKGWRFFDEIYRFDDLWIKLRCLEEQVSKLVNQIFQENPSLP